jgi:hypothetical protein
MIRSDRERVEQAVAFGRSLDWIVTHLHVEPSFVDEVLRRMDAPARSTEDEQAPWLTFPPAEPDVLAELLDAIVPSHPRADQNRIQTVRGYVEAGWTDRRIADRLGTTPSAISNLRARNGIPSARPREPVEPAHVKLVREYASVGCTDREIGAVIGRKSAAVAKLRQRHGIPAGKTRRAAA